MTVSLRANGSVVVVDAGAGVRAANEAQPLRQFAKWLPQGPCMIAPALACLQQVKAGCIGNDHQHGPTSVFPCLVGRAGSKPHSAGILAVGEECMHASGLTNSSPVSGGIVTSYPDMEAVWEHTFNGQLGINCDQSKVCKQGNSA